MSHRIVEGRIVNRSSETAEITATVILCTRDRATRLTGALESLAEMAVPDGIEWEILVVDNGSTDATRETIEAFIRDGNPRFRYSYESGPGKTYALNRGLQAARGEILAFTDDDALVDRMWLANIIDSMRRHSADGVGGKVLPIWRGQRPAWLSDRFLNVLAIMDYGDDVIRLDWKNPPGMLYGVNYAFRRSVFDRMGGFNTTLGSRGEDQELFDRLAKAGAEVVYDPSVVVHHEIIASRLTRKYYRDWYRATGRARAKLDHASARSVMGIPLFMMRKGLETLSRAIAALVRGELESAFAEYLTLNCYAAFYAARVSMWLHRGLPTLRWAVPRGSR